MSKKKKERKKLLITPTTNIRQSLHARVIAIDNIFDL